MKNFRFVTGLFLIALLVSCSSSRNKNQYCANAVEMLPWVNNNVVKEVKQPDHQYAFFVDSTHEYSYGFKLNVKNLNIKNPKKMTASCDGYLYKIPTSVHLVIEIRNNETCIHWVSQNFAKEKTIMADWKKVSLTTNLPKETNENTSILVYVWSQAHEAALIDNITVTFE